MGFEIKSPDDLSKILGDIQSAHESSTKAIGDVDSKLGTFVDELAEVKRAVEEVRVIAGRRVVSAGEGDETKAIRLPVTNKEWAEHGMKAFASAPVHVTKNADGSMTSGDGPVAEFQRAHDLVIFECLMRGKQATLDNLRATKLYRELYVPAREKVFALIKEAFNISTAGEGLEWIDTLATSEMQARVRLGWRVVGLFPRVSMPRSPYLFPVFRDDVTAKYVPTPTSSAGSAVAEGLSTANVTASMTLTGRRLMTRLIWSWDFEEDAIVAAASEMRDAAAASMSNAWETACINGDRDGTHMDSDIGASTEHATVAWDGLRKVALAGTAKQACAGAALDSAANWNLYVNRGVFTPMARYGLDRSKVAFITGSAVGNQARAIERFATAEVFAQALNRVANVNAEGAFSPDGISAFVCSEFMREDLNDSGVYDGVTTDKTAFIVVNRNAWKVGEMSTVGFKLLDQTRANQAQNELILSSRGDFQAVYSFDTIHTGIGYEVANN